MNAFRIEANDVFFVKEEPVVTTDDCDECAKGPPDLLEPGWKELLESSEVTESPREWK